MNENIKEGIGLRDGLNRIAKHEHLLKILVRISEVITCVLLAVFFITVIQNLTMINREVESVKEGPYPVSVAAGHIETNIVHLQALIDHLTASQLSIDKDVEQKYEYYFADIIADLQSERNILRDRTMQRFDMIDQFDADFDLLRSRLSIFTVMCWNSGSASGTTDEELLAYANNYLYPVIDSLLNTDSLILEETTYAVDSVYDSVNDAVRMLFIVATVIMVSVIVMIIIYMLLLRTKTRFENELRENLSIALAEANNANKAKSSFLSNMSHDIRTPMNAIVGLTAIADENIDDKLRVKQCLTRISTSSQHLLSLINDVLDMNKIESGKVVLAEEVFSIKNLIGEIGMIVGSQPQSHRVESRIELDDIEHDLLIGDTMRLKQILLNLTSNALKYTNEGDEIELLVRENPMSQDTRTMRPGWADLVFVVADTGIGMKPEFVKRIFEPFERENNDFTIFTEGTGLGMAITKNLVELMGGTVSVESELGMGTTVTMDIPFKIAPEDAVETVHAFSGVSALQHDADPGSADQAAGVSEDRSSDDDAHGDAEQGDGAEAGSGSRREIVSGRVLVVEDNDINMEIAQELISSRGAEVEGAADGLEAVKTVTSKPEDYYDLIFMDWQMPHMNGIEATKAIRKHFDEHGMRQVPIVAMTANAFESDREQTLAAGMDDFMSKPINIGQLEDMLRRYLQPPDAEQSEQ